MEPTVIEDVLPLKEVTKRYILKTLKICNGNKSEVARILGVHVKTIRAHADPSIEYPEHPKPTPKPEVKEDDDKDFPQPVTPEERDEWYNRDHF